MCSMEWLCFRLLWVTPNLQTTPIFAFFVAFHIKVRLIIPTRISIKAENLAEIDRAHSEIISQICPILIFFHTSTKTSKRFSRVTARNLTKIFCT